MAELRFYTGPMDSGKSTLALQTHHNHTARGRAVRLFTVHDRAGTATISSRLGLALDAFEVTPEVDLWAHVVDALTHGARIDLLVCDEAQFYTAEQVQALADVVDELGIDVFCFGILTDFRTRLFTGSARLVELADVVEVLQVEALCWCGERATHNARLIDGQVQTTGAVLVVGDTASGDPEGGAAPGQRTTYETLCRKHHRRQMASAQGLAIAPRPEPLPFDDPRG